MQPGSTNGAHDQVFRRAGLPMTGSARGIFLVSAPLAVSAPLRTVSLLSVDVFEERIHWDRARRLQRLLGCKR